MANGFIFIVRAATQILRILEDICIKEFYRDHLHREFHLIFNKKKLSSNFVNQLYSTHFLQQLPGRLFKISADRSGAYYKEVAWSRGTIIKKLLTLIKKQVCFLCKKMRIKELGPQEGKRAGLIRGVRSKRNKNTYFR